MTREEFLITIIVAIVGTTTFWTFVTEVWKHFRDKKRKQINPEDIQLMQAGMLAMLHDILFKSCRFYLSKGKIDEDGYANLEILYKSYHGLGGNGTGTELYNRASRLKIVESIEDEVL